MIKNIWPGIILSILPGLAAAVITFFTAGPVASIFILISLIVGLVLGFAYVALFERQ